jgi:hypothetical protein
MCTTTIVATLGYTVFSSFPSASSKNAEANQPKKSRYSTTDPSDHSLKDPTSSQETSQAIEIEEASLIPKEAILTFNDDESFNRARNELAKKGILITGSSDRLRALRVSYFQESSLDEIDDAEIAPNYPVSIPAPPEVSAQDGAQPFGADALAAIGVFEDNSDWGSGVKIAVIDSGINNHLSLSPDIPQIEITELADDSTQLSHGTAVASIIAGQHSLTRGVAPAAELVSVRVTDEFGSSDSFTLAEGILSAADSGAQIINISMGSEGDSSIVADAVRYAQDRGAVIVASSGNEGLSQTSYPAGYDGVISVGAIEANGDHVDFSNSGDNLTLVAPGYQVNAAWGEDLLTSFSGTSASAPFVSGAIAAAMSNNTGYNAQQAVDLLLRYTNEAGPEGSDPQYGYGALDLGRALERDTPDIYDMAVTSHLLSTTPNGDTELTVIFQNQGTATVFNAPAQITSPAGVTQLSINSLSPGEIHSITIPLPNLNSQQAIDVYSSVNSPNQDNDLRNNNKENRFQTNSE